MSSYLINACMRQSPDAVARKDFASAAVTSHAPPGNDVMYLSDAYYNSQLYPTSRAPPNVAGFGMHEKLLGGNGGGSVFQQHGGFGDPGSPMGYSASGLQYKPTPSLHNGLRPHHDATAALTHRPPSVSAAGSAGVVDEKSPAALSPPLSSSPGSSPPLAETDQGAAAAPSDASDAAVTAVDDSSASQAQQQQQQQSPTEPLIYPWMRRVHSGHGGKTNNNHLIYRLVLLIILILIIIIVIIRVQQKRWQLLAKRRSIYVDLGARYIFEPIAVETLGVFNASARHLLVDIGRRISLNPGEARETSYLYQRILVLVSMLYYCTAAVCQPLTASD